MEVKEHGSSGYRAGCRCFVCRLAHKDDVALYRARKRGEVPAPKAPAVIPDGAGVQESLTLSEIAGLDLDTMEGASLANMATTAARAVDAIERSGRWHLMPAAVRSLTQLMDKLRALDIPETADAFEDDEFIRSLGTPVRGHRDHLPWT
ncbi:hypothetical protein [Arthrobacter sp. FW306-04-A]|uniref:hypothetical protein n=1 Tax=Arthrobacter sp. FW306-04-A TaxID=2879619 RepID=UPI0037BF2B5A|nr:hypothetical protein LFT43_12360 [Arthrobacter sp. FW306-04-A]